MEVTTLVFRLRSARRKARAAGVAEAVSLLADLGARAAPGGPLSAVPGVFWITLPSASLDRAAERLPLLGYSSAVDAAEPARGETDAGRTVTWKRRPWRLVRIYEEEASEMREDAPDRRTFLLESASGDVRPVRGYRGSGDRLTRRGLPVADARLLVNLVRLPRPGVLLDPFAGTGGIVIEAARSGWRVISSDVDPRLRHGLAELAHEHLVADARKLPLADASVQAVASEPPYDADATDVVVEAIAELHRVLEPGGKLSLLAAAHQAERLRRAAADVRFAAVLDTPVDRKGLEVVAFCWRRP